MASVGWIGAVGVFLVLAVTGLTDGDSATVRGSYLAMDAAARFVIVPLALGALLTGVVQSLGTSWGLLRHYWVLVKFLVTVVATIVLLLQLGSISELAAVAARESISSNEFRAERISLVLHAGVGLLVLLVPLLLSIYKPRGFTPLGRRERRVGVVR